MKLTNEKGQATLEFVGVAVIIIVAAWFIIQYLLTHAPANVPQLTISEPDTLTYVDMTLEEAESWRASEFNVDVKITSSHAWLTHGNQDATDALKCASRNGTLRSISENESRRLHLLCRDEETGNEYVIIIKKIRRAIDSYRNATSELITAFKLVDKTIETYIFHEVVELQSAIEVKLHFQTGELFFSP